MVGALDLPPRVPMRHSPEAMKNPMSQLGHGGFRLEPWLVFVPAPQPSRVWRAAEFQRARPSARQQIRSGLRNPTSPISMFATR